MFRVFRPGVPLALASCGPLARPPSFAFLFFPLCAPLVSGVPCFPARVPWALASCGSPARSPFVLSPSPAPPPFFSSRLARLFFVCFLFFCFLLLLFFGRCVPVLRCWGWFVCPWLGGVLVCVAVACFCWAGFLRRAAAPCCRCLVPCRGLWLCSVLGCGAAFFWCAACRAVCCCLRRVFLVVLCCFVRAGWCCVLLPVVAGCWLLGLVARCCFPVACVVVGAPTWPRGLLPCCVLWFVAVPRSPVLCPVFCGAVLLCGAVLWCHAVRFPLLVVLVCVLSLSVRCCVALCVVLLVPCDVVCPCVLWCLPWRSVVWWCCPLVWHGVSWHLAVLCCVLWCCVALWCRAAGLCCVFSFAAGVPLLLKNDSSVLGKTNYTLPNAHTQAGSKTI